MPSVTNGSAVKLIQFDEKFPDLPIARLLIYIVLIMTASLFGPALLFGTLEYLLA